MEYTDSFKEIVNGDFYELKATRTFDCSCGKTEEAYAKAKSTHTTANLQNACKEQLDRLCLISDKLRSRHDEDCDFVKYIDKKQQEE